MTTDEKKKSPSTALAPYKPTPLAIPDASLGSLEEYIRAANKAPILSAEREHELAVRLQEHGDMEAAGELVMSHRSCRLPLLQHPQCSVRFRTLLHEG